jgi:hypothetical protein
MFQGTEASFGYGTNGVLASKPEYILDLYIAKTQCGCVENLQEHNLEPHLDFSSIGVNYTVDSDFFPGLQ